MIQLRRFTSKKVSSNFSMMYQQIAGQQKVNDLVDFPIDSLDMREHCLTLKDEPEPVLYDLYAVSNHSGGLGGGHYTACCKNMIDMKWYSFNDSSHGELTDVKRRVVTPSAYLLFYRRRGMDVCDSPMVMKRQTSMTVEDKEEI